MAGLIKRRLLVNFRADPDVVQAVLPAGFRPKLHAGHSIVGICLIRLEQIRPKGLPAALGLSSENAAHRIAVEWNDSDGVRKEGVYIPRRDTDSPVNAFAGGRLFPGEHHHSRFNVEDDGNIVALSVTSHDGTTTIRMRGRRGDALPTASCFDSFPSASAFFECGCVGYSVTRSADRLDGVELRVRDWQVEPMEISEVHSSFFEDQRMFPRGTVEFDHCLLMRDIPHEWHQAGDFQLSAV
jgi:Uncharacterized conserved protein (COG2071).